MTRIIRMLVVATVAATSASAIIDTPVTACIGQGVGCEDSSVDRVVIGSDGEGRMWASQVVPAGSALLVGSEPPRCQYPLGVASAAGEEVPMAADGRWVYSEVLVDREFANQEMVALVDEAWGLAGLQGPVGVSEADFTSTFLADYTPLDEVNRRFRVGCQPPGSGTVLFSAPYGGFVDVGPWDPVFGLQARVAVMRDQLQLAEPVVADFAEAAEWGGLVVRYPAWLAVDAEAWRVQTSPSVSYRGWSLQLVAAPRQLDFSVSFEPNMKASREGARPWQGVVGCIGTATERELVAGDDQVPVRPDDPDLEWSEQLGVIDACAWVPPASGQVTIQATIAYDVILLANGSTDVMPTSYYTGPAVTYRTGELIAVNTNGLND
jgi:hypothetical protein